MFSRWLVSHSTILGIAFGAETNFLEKYEITTNSNLDLGRRKAEAASRFGSVPSSASSGTGISGKVSGLVAVKPRAIPLAYLDGLLDTNNSILRLTQIHSTFLPELNIETITCYNFATESESHSPVYRHFIW